MLNLAVRNFKLYIKDRGSVFFSFLGVLVIIGLYFLFLGDGMKKDFIEIENSSLLMDTWVMAGIVAVASITTSMGAFEAMVIDKVRKNTKDFLASPVKKYQIVGGYVLSGFIVGCVMSFITLAAALIFLYSQGYSVSSPLVFLKISGIILLAVLSSSSIVLFIVSFLKSTGAYSNVSILLGTLIGFVTGMYIPIGSLSEQVQWVIKCFPVSHASALLRQTMMEDMILKSFDHIPKEGVLQFQEQMGITFTFGDTTCTTAIHIAILCGTAIIFFLLSLLILSRKEK